MVGTLVGADSVVNEITAHLHGALATDPDVDTIFEIGGQDSKFIRARHGVMQDSNMNYVCAAGTGSFVEEQALKLGYPVEQVGPMVMGVSPPHTSDRCTVFMEQDVERLIRLGYKPREALAAVMYSVVENYLAKVVGNRSYSRNKVFFCGATARNQGLVAAFEKLLDAEVVVSPYCHVLGAYGVALLTRDRLLQDGAETTFKGLDLTKREITLTQEECDLCTNTCKITYAHISGEDEVPSWGYLCGRDPDATEKRKTAEFDPFRKHTKLAAAAFANHRDTGKKTGPTVGVPQALSTYSHGPLWQTFLSNLGCQIRLSRPTNDRTRELSGALVGAEYCFPAKLAHGHVAELAGEDGVEFIFMPHIVSEPVPEGYSNAFFCPVICALPAMGRAALRVAGRPGAEKILAPPVDFRWDVKRQVKELTQSLGKPLGVSGRSIRKAWEGALTAQSSFVAACEREGEALTAAFEAGEKPCIVFLGRAYNLFDGNANLELPLKVAEKGFDVFPTDFVPIHEVELGPELKNIYWTYGQRLLKALEWVRDKENIFPIWLTNFKCGPDSFLLTYAEKILGEKPFLILELDEHGGDAGYLTRVEAFLDVIQNRKEKAVPRPPALPNRDDPEDVFKDRTIWVPPLHTIAAQLAAAAMRGHGYDGRALPLEDDESMALGRQVTRGGECIPMTVTIGRLLQTLRAKGGDGSTDAFFMPSACGPCRFGQYNLLERIILEEEGFGDVAIMAPNNDNAYQGLEESLRRQIYTGTLIGDLIFKVGCRFRPYHDDPSAINEMVDNATKIMERAFESGSDLKPAFREGLAPFREIPKPLSTKPLVGIVGEIFVRCNDFSNQRVVDVIEANGGEAWLAPFHEWVLYAAWEHERRAKEGWDIMGRAKSYVKNKYLFEKEQSWHRETGDLLSDRHEPTIDESAEAGFRYASFNYGGEVLMAIGRTVRFFEQGASLVVNCSPFGCMPGQVTTGILAEVQSDMGKPVLNLFYDGTGDMNRVVGVFLRNLQGKR
jgi:predicted nucleotide-binding protein (sugar kinase/HSP70/actin superfamily)